jgi:ferrous iron transport protein A
MPTLCDISPGQSANVLQIIGDDTVSLRLMEMGLIEGETVKVVGRAPMGDPIEISLRGYRLSLRLVEASRVEVEQPNA